MNGKRPGSAYRKKFNPKTFDHDLLEETDEPEFLVKASGDELIEKVRPKKKILMTKKEME